MGRPSNPDFAKSESPDSRHIWLRNLPMAGYSGVTAINGTVSDSLQSGRGTRRARNCNIHQDSRG